MDTALARAGRFRHVVFPDSVGGYGRAVNFAPPQKRAEPRAPRPDDRRVTGLSEDAESFLTGLFAHAGLSLRHYKSESLHRRLPACLRALRANSVAHARSILQRNPQLAPDAVAAMLIGVTSFFRDPAVFEGLRQHVLPRLVAARDVGRPLRVWSVACSDGAELYSVAMLLAELGALGGCELLGTDCRPAAVARAAAGVFEPAAVRGAPPDFLRRYFTAEGPNHRVHESLRAATRWRTLDALARDCVAPGPWDVVLCRNLVIYLKAAATGSLWASLAAALRPGGVLVLGKAERPIGVRGLSPLGPCLYRKESA